MIKIKFPYKNENNQRYSKQLFLETWRELPLESRTVEPAFTLYYPREGLICLREEYVADGDPSGYKTAMRLFGEYSYWKYLSKISWFKEALKAYDEELEAKLYSEGLDKIRELAKGEDAKALKAAEYLANGRYKQESGAKRGRPSKDEVEGRLKQETRERDEVNEDAARIRLVAK